MAVILLLGSTQLFSLGILGLYIHSIYLEVKGRPSYIVKSTYGFNRGSSEGEIKPQVFSQENQKPD